VLSLGVTAVKDRACPHQGWSRDHKPGRLNEANPFAVGDDLWVELGH
jgi:hypothetical protein